MKHLILVLTLVACAEPEPTLFDPTGTWDMGLSWSAGGTCGITGTTSALVTVAALRDGFLVSTEDPMETTTGSVTRTADQAFLNILVFHPDPNGDGSVVGELAINAGVGATLDIVGSGEIRFTGTANCTQRHTATGELR